MNNDGREASKSSDKDQARKEGSHPGDQVGKMSQEDETRTGTHGMTRQHPDHLILTELSLFLRSMNITEEPGYYCWGLIRKRSDVLMLGILGLAPAILIFALIPCNDTSDTFCVWMPRVAFLYTLLFVATLLYRSHEKFTTCSSTPRRSFAYLCLHTAMEICIISTINIVFSVFSKPYRSDFQPATFDFALVYLQIWFFTTVMLVYMNPVRSVGLQIQNNAIPKCCDIALLMLHIASFLLALEGIFRLVHYAWQYNPWTTPFCLALAWKGEYNLVRWWSSEMTLHSEDVESG